MAEKTPKPAVKLALEIGPVAAFFVAYMLLHDRSFTIGGTDYDGFVLVTAGFIPLILLSTGLLWWLTGKVAKMQLATAVLVVVFGGLTVWLNDERFFKMKPTMIYALFAVVLGVGLLRGRSYLEFVMDEVMPLTHAGWMVLTRRLALFFAVLAVLNEIVWRTMSTEAWVSFKTFGLTFAVFAFFIAQNGVLRRHAPDGDGA